ncbi:MAG TPA: cytochrome c biogenesis protein CcsA [Candidatus Xenobia bacterium]|jgi:ABC-type transport system involved in cytochrome c biogenesis permease subunit
MTSLTLYLLSAAGYAVAAALFQRNNEGRAWTHARVLLLVSLACHTTGIVAKAIEEPHSPFSSVGKTAPLVAWFLIVLYLIVGWRANMEILGTFAAPSAMLLMLAAAAADRQPGTPAQWSYWREIHVIAIFFGVAAFTLAAFCAIIYYRESQALKRKKLPPSSIPSLEKLDRWSHHLIVIGFPSLGVGWLAGSIGRGVLWSGTAAEYFTLATMILYAAYIHVRLISGWQGLRVNLLLIVGSVLLLVTYVGVSFLPSGFHP